MKKYFFILFSFSTLCFSQNKNIEQRIDSVLSLMTLDEKVGQLVQYSGMFDTGTKTQKPQQSHESLIREGKVGSFLNIFGVKSTRAIQKIAIEESRLKIPLIIGLDVIHGFKTIFPVPLAQACSWNPELVEKSSRLQAIETSAAGVHWTFGPVVDIARDPRWGRIMEGNGEDPYLGSVMAAASIKGFQGNDLSAINTIAACAKHFAGYGAVEGGRDYNTVDISERTLREVYLPPFKSAVDAGAATIMSAFIEIGGIPTSANKYMLTNILREEWKFNGFVVSDWNSIGELIQHGVVNDLKQAPAVSIKTGIDMDMQSNGYFNHLRNLVEEKIVDEGVLNESVRRILRVKFMLGLFDDPYKYCDEERENSITGSKEIVEAAREVARESIVLLKNENSLLPLNKNIKKIAVIGPLANSNDDPLGPWSMQGKPENVVTVVQGLKNKLGLNSEIVYSEGCKFTGEDRAGFEDAVKVAENSDVVVLCIGEPRMMSGEANNRAFIDLPGVQEELAKEIHKTGKPIVAVLMNGRPLSINWISENIPAIIEAWYLGEQSGNALADVLLGEYNPSGKLTTTFPRTIGMIPYYYNHKSSGRPYVPNVRWTSYYQDVENSPLYPFGYGLSYTTFEYSNLFVYKKTIHKNDSLKISVDVKNSGKYDGQEVVQLYIRDLVGSVTRPVKELKDFKKVFLKPGETKKVEFIITEEKLKFYDVNMKYVSEPGDFKVFVGTNSVNVLETSFSLAE
jgi:beta-glucosidase